MKLLPVNLSLQNKWPLTIWQGRVVAPHSPRAVGTGQDIVRVQRRLWPKCHGNHQGNSGVIINREAESFAGLSLEQIVLFIGLAPLTPQGPQLPSAALGLAGPHVRIINSHQAGSDGVAYAVEPEAEK